MARKQLKADAQLNNDNRDKILEAIGDLLSEHAAEVNGAITDSDDRRVTVNFAVEIDGSDSAPQIDVKCRFTPCTITDKRTLKCDDPQQGNLTIYTPEELAKKAEAEAKELAKLEAVEVKAAAKAEKKAKKDAARAGKDLDPDEGAED